MSVAEVDMTEQEAMEIIMRVAYDGEFPNNSNEVFGIACKCIEKQIPKKMNPNFNCIYCDCGNPIYYQTDRLLHHYNYCCECGQAIKWE